MDGWYAGVSVLAILAGPVIAVQLQKYLEKRSDNKRRKIQIFKMLMATRAMTTSADHVQALNMIELEFQDKKPVLNAWREYLDHLGEQVTDEYQQQWAVKSNELLVSLLYVMGKSLGYDFDKVNLKRGAYFPTAQRDMFLQNRIVMGQLTRILTGEIPLRVTSVAPDPQSEGKFRAAQDAFINIINGDKPICIKILDSEGTALLGEPLGSQAGYSGYGEDKK